MAPSSPTTPHDVTAPDLVGSHPSHLAALRSIVSLAPYEQATILIEGETGTGKSYVARLLHDRSPRARAVFHPVVLSTLDDNLASSDLFGHLSGSYTGAQHKRDGSFVTANRGTLFLDEIGKASSVVQRKLLHAIEHREIWQVGSDRAVRLDVRLVAASNIPLETLVERGTFLEDLAARLTPFRVRLPALRERRTDIPALVRQFVDLRATTFGHPLRPPRVHDDLMSALCRAKWPQNLRQLDGVVKRLLIEAAMHDSKEMSLNHCVDDLAWLRAPRRKQDMPSLELVLEALAKLKKKSKVARHFGISRWTVDRILERARSQEIERDT